MQIYSIQEKLLFDDMIGLVRANGDRNGEENRKEVVEQNIYNFFPNVNLEEKDDGDDDIDKYYIAPHYYIQYQVKRLQF